MSSGKCISTLTMGAARMRAYVAARRLMRAANAIRDKTPRDFYVLHVKNSFRSHADEDDPAVVEGLLQRADEDLEWYLNKFELEDKYSAKVLFGDDYFYHISDTDFEFGSNKMN